VSAKILQVKLRPPVEVPHTDTVDRGLNILNEYIDTLEVRGIMNSSYEDFDKWLQERDQNDN
jgi:hypothetical protein